MNPYTTEFETLAAAERAEIDRSRARRRVPPLPSERPDESLAGLAISGGGIRSASLALGVLQAFASRDLLRRFDYLSTVSGGGYIGSSLTWLLARREEFGDHRPGLDRATFPFGTDAPGWEGRDAPWQRRVLDHLRLHGNYLTPGAGLTLMSGTGAVLRAVLLNLAVWIPLVVLAMFLLMTAGGWTAFEWPRVECCSGEVECGDAPVQCAVRAIVPTAHWPFDWWLVGAAVLAGIFVAGAVLYSLSTFFSRGSDPSGSGGPAWSYRARRRLEIFAGKYLGLLVAVAVVASLPLVARRLGEAALLAGGVSSVLLGVGAGVVTFFRSAGSGGRVPVGWIATAGAVLLLYGVTFLGYYTALEVLADGGAARRWLFAASLVAAVSGLVVNLNHIGLHRFYRDRLMETFLPPVRKILDADGAGYTGPSPRADGFRLSQLAGRDDADDADDAHPGPYHLVNTNVVLVDSHERTYRMRGGDSFLLSPLYCGSGATGWLGTRAFVKNGMTLPTAMAISGAAANPDTGVGGVGLTRSKAVSMLMALLNIRLGYWVRNPALPQRFKLPSHFTSALYELGFYRETSKYLQLSDGGHFENLALYELIRRRVQLIVVSDGGEDGGYVFGDLQNALRRILEDFGVRLEFDVAAGEELERLIPSAKNEPGYPVGVRYADRGFLVGTIVYPARGDAPAKSGTLIYLKSTMTRGVGIRAKGYKATNPAFPHESTADQFFSEDQMDAYRELGYRIGAQASEALERAFTGLS